MGRVCWSYENAAAFASGLTLFKNLRVDGILTHFASAEDSTQADFTNLQIDRFDAACYAFREGGHEPKWFDLANSPGAIIHPGSRGNMVRLGGALFGLLEDILTPDTKRPELKPVLSLSSKIANLKNVPAGETLGYGRTFTTKRDSVIALLPIGYADGYPRGLSNRSKAFVNGNVVPIVGRISMDWTLLDVTDVAEIKIGDEVFLIGGGGPDHAIKAADLARELGTIGYEITCGISPRVPRIYHENKTSQRS
jgi:alanine racemase